MSLVTMIEFNALGDERGFLFSLESNRNIPFEIKRVYYMGGVTKDLPRGFHAHKQLQQVAVCISGECRMVLDDGVSRSDVLLNSPSQGIYIGSMIWREMHDFSDDCILMVLASEPYDELDYIRDYKSFTEIVSNA